MTLKEMRLERGWSQSELALKVGSSKRAVQHWEQGVTPLSFYQKRLARAFGLKLSDLPL